MKFLLIPLVLLAIAAAQDAPAKPRLPVVSAEEFGVRRAELMRRTNGTPVIIPCEELKGGEPGIDSNTPLYDFDYLAGMRKAGSVLVVTEEGSFLFTDAKDREALSKRTHIKNILKSEEFEEFLDKVFEADDEVLLIGFGGRRRPYAESRKIRAQLKERDLDVGSSPGNHLLRMRAIKSDREKEMMRVVTRQTNEGHKAAMRAVKPGMNEKELQKVIEAAFKKHGGTGLGFPSIVGSGMNGTILHYMRNNKEIGEDVLIVCDLGSGYHGYSSDVTRTIPSNGTFNKEQREIYQCVLDAQKAAEELLEPGVTWRELQRAAVGVIKDRGLTEWSYAHSRDRSVRHGLGHFVGLSVHDSGPYGRALEEGMCITIEPGIYDKDQGIGVRIEDIYLITKDGFERLSKGAPREIEEIEKLMSNRKGDR